MYKCIRCETEYQNKTDIERHLNIKNKCKSKYKNFILSNDDVIKLSVLRDFQKEYFVDKKILNKDKLICEYCFYKYTDKKSMKRHLSICNMKSCKDYYYKIGSIYNDIINNKIDLIKTNEIINFNNEYSEDHLTLEQKCLILLNLDPFKTFEYILLNKKNLNILPINTSMSCIIVDNKVKKINNKLLLEVLFFKIKQFIKKIKRDLEQKEIINTKIINIFKDIDLLCVENINYSFLTLIKNIYKKNIINTNYFINNDLIEINKYDDIINYFENIELEYILNINSFEDEVKYDHKGDRLIYSKNGHSFIFDIWNK
jgi:hypothetical protein